MHVGEGRDPPLRTRSIIRTCNNNYPLHVHLTPFKPKTFTKTSFSNIFTKVFRSFTERKQRCKFKFVAR